MNAVTPQKIGIFGGAFNPPHLGHLILAETALDQFALHQVLWLPTYHPPHKPAPAHTFSDRWEMVQRAIAPHPQFVASDLEQQLGGISYAHRTLQTLTTQNPHTEWYWLLGADAFQTLPHWQHSHTLMAQCTWLVAPRSPTAPNPPPAPRPAPSCRWHTLAMPPVGISSSLIRHYCQTGRSLRYLLPDPVRHYIQTHQLYQTPPPHPINEPTL